MAAPTDEQIETYHTGSGWYEYPGNEGKLRKKDLLTLLDGDEFQEEPVEEAVVETAPRSKRSRVEVDALVRGNKNFGVVILRTLLNLHGLPTSIKPAFDGELERAVMEFQQTQKIPVTGVADQPTWARLLSFERAI